MVRKPLVSGRKRESVARPPRNDSQRSHCTSGWWIWCHGNTRSRKQQRDGGDRRQVGILADKHEDLEREVHAYPNVRNNTDARNLPIVKFPPNMTGEEWARHQVTHTPYAPGCRHCVAARPIRRQHPKMRKHNVIVPDIDGSKDGPTKMSMDYMYLGERNKGDQDTFDNPPHLVVIDHRHGRIWAHRVPPNGA